MDFSSSYPSYTARRSCFAKRFSKTDSTTQNLLHRHSHSRSCHNRSWSPTKDFLYIFFISRFCKNIWSARNFAKLYICRRGPRRQGHNVVAHGVRDITSWPTVGAASSGPLVLDRHSAVAHDVRSIAPCYVLAPWALRQQAC
jgi:hypothetical protein